ncbi:hypothetical protein [Dactylosporangium sp. CA-233914]|uniref:hypothetical protein n=1 Tax=Dactylosporangium sp. CA-233914 TaxID=3239934 RepID=UPI003D94004B
MPGSAVTDRLAGGDDLTGDNVQGSEQIRDAVPAVVVGALFGDPEIHGQQRLGAVQSLHLGRFVDREHDRAAGRVEVQPDDAGDLPGEARA